MFSLDVHHLFIAGMVRSYDVFQPGGALMWGDLSSLAVSTIGKAFAIGIQLSAPFLLYGFIFNVALGFIARMTPTIQVFFVAQPLNMLFTFGLLIATAGLILGLFVSYFADAVRTLAG
jgi:flagellar biosynthetic protein FliR